MMFLGCHNFVDCNKIQNTPHQSQVISAIKSTSRVRNWETFDEQQMFIYPETLLRSVHNLNEAWIMHVTMKNNKKVMYQYSKPKPSYNYTQALLFLSQQSPVSVPNLYLMSLGIWRMTVLVPWPLELTLTFMCLSSCSSLTVPLP